MSNYWKMWISFYIESLIRIKSYQILCARDEYGRKYEELFVKNNNRSLKKARSKIIRRAKILSGKSVTITNTLKLY